MATISTFQEIDGWKMARALARGVYAVSGTGAFAKDFPLRDQIRRAAISIMANIAEGFERGGNAEFIQFLSVARGSAGEVEAQLYIALDQKYIEQEEFNSLVEMARSTRHLISGFIEYLKQCELRGQKFK